MYDFLRYKSEKTISKQLAVLKKDLAKKEPVKNQSLYDVTY